jgi:hypothetical protein
MTPKTVLVLLRSLLRSVGSLLGGRIRFPQHRLGSVLELPEGDRFVLYRETALRSAAAGAIETPRLWKNADLPRNEWVGRGLTIHFGDNVMGLWAADDLDERLGEGTVDQHEGQDIAARFDYPGLGMLQTVGTTPGVGAILGFGASASGFTFQNDPADAPWDTAGRLAGPELKRLLGEYRRMLQILVVSDDRPHRRNGVTVTPGLADEHGPIPVVNYEPSEGIRDAVTNSRPSRPTSSGRVAPHTFTGRTRHPPRSTSTARCEWGRCWTRRVKPTTSTDCSSRTTPPSRTASGARTPRTRDRPSRRGRPTRFSTDISERRRPRAEINSNKLVGVARTLR